MGQARNGLHQQQPGGKWIYEKGARKLPKNRGRKKNQSNSGGGGKGERPRFYQSRIGVSQKTRPANREIECKHAAKDLN